MSVPKPVGICDTCSCLLWEESEIGQQCGRPAPLNGVCKGRFVPYEQHVKESARLWAERLIQEGREQERPQNDSAEYRRLVIGELLYETTRKDISDLQLAKCVRAVVVEAELWLESLYPGESET